MEGKNHPTQRSRFSQLQHTMGWRVAVPALAAPAGAGTDGAVPWPGFRSDAGCWEMCSGWYLGSSSSKSSFSPTQTTLKQNLLFFLLSPLLTPPLRSDGHHGDVAAGCHGWMWVMLLATMCCHGAELGAQQMLSIWPFFWCSDLTCN